MKNRKLTSLLCGGVLSLTGASLVAQQATTPANPPTSPSQSQSSQSTLGQSSSTSSLSPSSAMPGAGKDVRLSQIMNSSVQSQEGKTLGHIRDLVIDPQSGRIEFAILSLSSAGAAADTSTSGRETVPSSRSSTIGTPSSATGTTTTGKMIPVPWQLFSQSWSSSSAHSTTTTTTTTAMGAQNLVLNLDESKLRTAPSFDASDWSQLQSGTLDQRVYSHFGVDRSSAIGTPGSSISGRGASGTYDPNNPSSTQPRSGRPQGSSDSSSGSTTPQPNPDR